MAKLVVGVNDLGTVNPEVAAQWHPTKNGTLTHRSVTTSSNRKAHWKCVEGHEWEARIGHRSAAGTGCPFCSGKRILIGFNDLGTTNPELISEWHSTKNGVLTPLNVNAGSSKNAHWQCAEGHEWEARIGHRAAGSGCPYCSGKRVLVGFNDLATVKPELAEQWHPTKNGRLTPQSVTAGSNRKARWTCGLGHEWTASIALRSNGCNCPFCSGNRILVGFNDLATVKPELAEQWHPVKNGSLTPQDVMPGSNQKVWWKCNLSHEWETIIGHRSAGRGCPYCSGYSFQVGINDLATGNPALAAQWHPTKNGSLTPKDVAVSGRTRVWWLCPLLHEWETTISQRSTGSGCPTCSGRLVKVGFNDLSTINPELAAQWHPTKNGMLTPQNITASAAARVWWRCSLLHEWKTKVCYRMAGSGCPYCVGRVPIVGSTDLATINPDLASQWHPVKNGSLTPQDVMRRSNQKAWWICSFSHEWEATISQRSAGGSCPTCSGKRVQIGFNDLATVNPELAAQWHPTKNGMLTPQKITVRARLTRVWWVCPLLHEWETTIRTRITGSGCPKCSMGLTEQKFREAFEKFSEFEFESGRIPLIRPSRKRGQAQIDMINDDLKLVIEYDGEWTHGSNSPDGQNLNHKLANDKETTQALVDIDYKVIRIRNHSFNGKLPFVPLDPRYVSNVFQINYKSFGKDKDDIEKITQIIIREKEDWFRIGN